MNGITNPFCISKTKLVQMFWGQSTKKRLDSLIQKFAQRYSLLEMYEQMRDDTGEVGKYWNEEQKEFSIITEHEEIAQATL